MNSEPTPMELSAIGAMLHPSTRSEAVFAAPETLFASDVTVAMIQAIKSLYGQGYTVTPEALSVALHIEHGYPTDTASSWVAAAVGGAASTDTLPFILKSLGVARVRQLTTDLASGLQKDSKTIRLEDVLGRVTEFQRLVAGMDHNKAETYEQAVRDLATMDKVKYFVPGMPPLDKVFQIDEGTVCYVGGRSAGGKTSFGLNMIKNIAQAGHRCGVIEIEMRRKPLAARLSGMMSRVDTRRAMKGETIPAEREQMLYSLEQNIETVKRIRGIEPSSFHADMIKPTIERWRDEWGCEIVLLDYVQLLLAKGSTETEIVKNASRAVTEAAKSTDIPIIGLSQARRSEGDVKMQDFKQSAQLEHDADTMVVLNPVEGYNPGDEDREIYCELVKSRNGMIGKDILNFHLPSQTFTHTGRIASSRPQAQAE